jgi:alanyl-tRNA synthetase
MAELTKLEAKLGEVTGLAMAAQAATKKVTSLAKDEHPELVSTLERMHDEASETERRCTELADALDGKKTAILEEARATKTKGAEMMSTYLDADADALDGFEFLTMAEAGEVGHWSVLKKLNERKRSPAINELVTWALPIQEGHLKRVTETSLELASEEDPDEEA